MFPKKLVALWWCIQVQLLWPFEEKGTDVIAPMFGFVVGACGDGSSGGPYCYRDGTASLWEV